MGTEALTIIFLLAIALILGISLVIVIQDLFKLEKRLEKSEEENTAFKNALQKEADIVIEDAHKRALHVVDEANRKAMEIVSSSELYDNEAKAELKQNLATVTKAEREQIARVGDELITAYRDALQGIKQDSTKIVQNITQHLEKQAATELDAFTTNLRKETLESQQELQKRLDAEYNAAQQEVTAYKQAQMKKAQDEIFTLVHFLTEEALGKGLTIEQHQTLVLQALEEAKQQGVIR